ncbi:peroxidase 4-like [Dorcoceras hygrometricum]|uniref:Peroxidase 4-like n=1 Tax=Dorcoceras hygrometricum TaxID=472368 RepID=A0A2Z7D5K4_9LAMI|nr:peroxidase 4-like [Dorcoceras hygrometricum]
MSTDSSDGSKSGSVGLLLLRRFVLYRFWRLGVSSKRIVKEATLCILLAFEQICFSVQVSDLSARDLVVVIVAQKVKHGSVSTWEHVTRFNHDPVRVCQLFAPGGKAFTGNDKITRSLIGSTTDFQFLHWNALESQRIFHEQNRLAKTIAAKFDDGSGGRRRERRGGVEFAE